MSSCFQIASTRVAVHCFATAIKKIRLGFFFKQKAAAATLISTLIFAAACSLCSAACGRVRSAVAAALSPVMNHWRSASCLRGSIRPLHFGPYRSHHLRRQRRKQKRETESGEGIGKKNSGAASSNYCVSPSSGIGIFISTYRVKGIIYWPDTSPS